MIAALVLDSERSRAGDHDRIPEREVARAVVKELVAAGLSLESEREGGIRGDLDPLDRVHLDGDSQGHEASSVQAALQGLERQGGLIVERIAGECGGNTSFAGVPCGAEGARGLVQ